MKKLLSLLALTVFITGCNVDTTGLSGDSTRPLEGSPNASVLVQEFADLQCPSCKAAHEAVSKPLLEKYGTQIRFEYKHFPLRGIHKYALELAEAAECSADQQKFWEFVDIAFTRQDQLSSSAIKDWATELKLDMDLWGRCTKSHIKRDTILADYAEGEKMGVQGTPTYFVNGTRVDSNVAALGAAIDAALKGTAGRL